MPSLQSYWNPRSSPPPPPPPPPAHVDASARISCAQPQYSEHTPVAAQGNMAGGGFDAGEGQLPASCTVSDTAQICAPSPAGRCMPINHHRPLSCAPLFFPHTASLYPRTARTSCPLAGRWPLAPQLAGTLSSGCPTFPLASPALCCCGAVRCLTLTSGFILSEHGAPRSHEAQAIRLGDPRLAAKVRLVLSVSAREVHRTWFCVHLEQWIVPIPAFMHENITTYIHTMS